MPIKTIAAGLALCVVSLQARAVTFTTGVVNGLQADIWSWSDAKGRPRTLALKQEGHGNPGHGGYAIQLTYQAKLDGKLGTVTVNAETGSDGGFGYFVSHERYRLFADGDTDTIASHIFGTDDSPLGLDFAATTSMPSVPQGTGAERFVIAYGHYGTIVPDPVDPNTGLDSVPLPEGAQNYAFYPVPATTTWVVQDGYDYPRIDVSVGLSQVVPPGGMSPAADLVSFDLRGPYGVMVFDDGADGTVDTVIWGDHARRFLVTQNPVVRDSTWDWSAANTGARYQALFAGRFEMGLFEPVTLANSATDDGYAAERGQTSQGFIGGGGQSYSSCGDKQVLPSDGSWPYQSVQYSLPCGKANLNRTTTGKKIAWGSTGFYGTSLTSVYDGQKSFPFDGFPATGVLAYGVCVVLGEPAAGKSLTQLAADSFVKRKPKGDCPETAVK